MRNESNDPEATTIQCPNVPSLMSGAGAARCITEPKSS